MTKYILLVFYLVSTLSGLILVKLGGVISLSLTRSRFAMEMSHTSIIGIVLYGISFLSYLSVLQRFNLSYIVPICTGVVYVSVLLLSSMVLKEPISRMQLIGIVFIAVGVIIMNLR